MDSNTRRAAIIPADRQHQHYFCECGISGIHSKPPYFGNSGRVRVLRISSMDVAEIIAQAPGSAGQISVWLSAGDLRRLASDLLDAAHDIDQNPPDRQVEPTTKTTQVAA